MTQTDRTVDESLGGEIGDMIKSLFRKQFQCTCHNKKMIRLETFVAYPHDGGLADKDGNKWWLYVTCPHCGYEWSWHKLQNRLERQKEMKT